MPLSTGDQQIVSNIRHKFGARVARYSDYHIATTFNAFSGSEDYNDEEKFVEDWLPEDPA
jgi:hypothetical protein